MAVGFEQLRRMAEEVAARQPRINTLTGAPLSIPGLGQMPTRVAPTGGLGAPYIPPSAPEVGTLGQTQNANPYAAAYQPPPVGLTRIPNGLGSEVFRSTLAPLQQPGYGLGQVSPLFLTQQNRQPGGANTAIGFSPAPPLPIMQRPPKRPVQVAYTDRVYE